jgi:hypothetical protein
MMRWLILFALFIVAIGLFLLAKMQIPYLSWVGRLPGDVIIQKGNATIYFPLTTSFLFSVLVSLVLHKWSKSSSKD